MTVPLTYHQVIEEYVHRIIDVSVLILASGARGRVDDNELEWPLLWVPMDSLLRSVPEQIPSE